ncbi:ABC transporter ATP-binding protein, partial [Klebsiella pneumoniae]|nr:ABC transporter ATP-binding protein [Klebsiella pneumoniae]
MNKFTSVLLFGTALLAGCVDREGYYNSVSEEDSHGLTFLRGQPALRYNDVWSRWPRVYGATALY